ncbi:60S ribosomal protein L13-1 [Cucumispora dikerogammari]|nr:60S ribosomal protein L13-1 [Cucumispora dikerogammari]
MKHNIALPNNHFNKSNKKYKMSFNQAAQKHRRSLLRKRKAAAIYPRPARKLQPLVNCQSQRYNYKQKLGKGFSLMELENAGLTEIRARQLRIRVDRKRKNKSEESLNENVQRLKTYLNKLVFYKSVKEAKLMEVKQFMGKIKFDLENKKSLVSEVISQGEVENFSI